MDSASLPFLSNLLDGIDRWVELAPLLPVLISLEIILSADNAIALAAITRQLKNVQLQERSLNFGIGIALIFRITLILLAKYILKYWFIQLIAGLYLLWIFIAKLVEKSHLQQDINQINNEHSNFILTVLTIAFTDLAFSIDSVAAAVAISDQLLLVITGGLIGVLALRFTSGLFIRWLEIFIRLELAGYIAVGLVGLKLILALVFPLLYISEWIVLGIVFILLCWGFSKKESSLINS